MKTCNYDDVCAVCGCSECECHERYMYEVCGPDIHEVPRHVCSKCNALVSDWFYDSETGNCDICDSYPDDSNEED